MSGLTRCPAGRGRPRTSGVPSTKARTRRGLAPLFAHLASWVDNLARVEQARRTFDDVGEAASGRRH